MAAPILALLDLAHSEIAIHDVLPVLRREVVELRVLRRPALEVLRHVRGHLHFARALHLVELEAHRPLVDVGEDLVRLYVVLRHRLHPYRLPDARDARVEAARRIEALLAARVDEVLGRVPHAYRELISALLHVVRDVYGERILPALVRNVRHLVVPDEDHSAEVDAAEVEENPLSRLRVALYRAGIPEKLVGSEKPPNARESAFYRKRNEYLSVPLLRASGRIRHARDGVVPFAVQVSPIRAHHLRTRIAAPCVPGRDLLAPRRHHRSRLRQGRKKRRTKHNIRLLHTCSPLFWLPAGIFRHQRVTFTFVYVVTP